MIEDKQISADESEIDERSKLSPILNADCRWAKEYSITQTYVFNKYNWSSLEFN